MSSLVKIFSVLEELISLPLIFILTSAGSLLSYFCSKDPNLLSKHGYIEIYITFCTNIILPLVLANIFVTLLKLLFYNISTRYSASLKLCAILIFDLLVFFEGKNIVGIAVNKFSSSDLYSRYSVELLCYVWIILLLYIIKRIFATSILIAQSDSNLGFENVL